MACLSLFFLKFACDMKTRLLIILTLLLGSAYQAEAVDIYSRKLNTTNGLPDNNVRCLAQDCKGFLWMGTSNGLYRFDGYFYTNYRYADEGNLRLLNNNHINGCYALADGRMLFSEQGNTYSVFDVEQNRFVDMPGDEKKSLYAEARRRYISDKAREDYKSILENGGNYISDNLGNTIILDNKGTIWFVDRKTGETIRMKVYDEALFNMVSSQKYKVLTSEKKQLIWISTNGCGITVYDRKTRQEQHIRQESGLISTDYIQDICLDLYDNVWAADEFHGVVYLATAQQPLPVTHHLAPNSKELRSNQVFIMRWTADSTLLVANTKGDIYEADKTLRLRQIMTDMDMHTVCTDLQGQLWIGSRKQGFRSPEGNWHPHNDADPQTPSTSNIASILCDQDGRIWMGCDEGRLELITQQADGRYTAKHFLPEGSSPKVLMQDHQGTIWAGGRSGLYSFSPSQLAANPTAYKERLSAQDIRYNDVSCIYEDMRHRLWVGTNGNGVYFSTDGGETFSQLTTANGLISNEIQSLISINDTTLWIATKKGIACYQTTDGSCQYIYNEQDLQQNYYAENCVCLLPDGRIAYGTNKGIVVYDPHQTHEEHRGRLAITDLLINGISVTQMGEESPLKTSPDNVENIVLSHNQNSLTIRFSAFNFGMTAGSRYTYWLEDYDRDWSEVSTYSFASYKNLEPGTYTLHIKVFDNSSNDNIERTVTITIRHPWWLTWWAWLLYFIVACALSYAIYRQLRTIYNLRRRISIEQQLTEYKLQFFTNISHEFRTPLTIIRGAMDRIKTTGEVPANLRQPISSMQRSTDRMLRLINQLLEFRKMQNNKLRLALENTDIVAFVKEICQNFNDTAENKKIGYSFLPNVKTYQMFIDRQHVDKIVYNLLSNAFKYTPGKGTVSVGLNADEQWLVIRVADTGVGIPKEKQPELFQRFMQSTFSSDSIGIGLHLTKALVDVHHGTIQFEENQPQGSVFIVKLPTDKSVYQPCDFLQASELEATHYTQQQVPYQELMPEPMNDRKVLIVEDDADVANFLKQTLGRFFETETASDGSEALQRLAETTIDLVVSDVLMPIMDGYELTRQIRKNPKTQTLPIILLTALSSDEQRLKGIKHGADAYLTKPFDARLLITTCSQLIEQRDKLRQHFGEQPVAKVATPPEIIVEERDKQLLDMMNRWLSDHLSSPSLSVDEMAEAMGYRRSIFFRKVKALTGQTPADYIRTLRMNRAAELLREETITVAEVAYKVGINEPHYFTKVFKQQFGISPKKYQQGQKDS